jgi:hypothetical protein
VPGYLKFPLCRWQRSVTQLWLSWTLCSSIFLWWHVIDISMTQLISTKWQASLPRTVLQQTFWCKEVTSSEVKQVKNCLTPAPGTHRFSQMLVTNYHCTLQNIPEEWRSHLHGGRSLQSCAVFFYLLCTVNQFKCHIMYLAVCFSLSARYIFVPCYF